MKTTLENGKMDTKTVMRELILTPFLIGAAVMGGLTVLVGMIATIIVAVLTQ